MRTSMKMRIAVIAAGLFAALAVSGCGSSSGTASSAPASYAREEAYEAEADDGEGIAYSYTVSDMAAGNMKEAKQENVSEDAADIEEPEAPAAAEETPEEIAARNARKLIKTLHYEVETENLEELVADIDQRVTELGGYIENSNVDGISLNDSQNYGNGGYYQRRRASFTIRIPANKVDDFAKAVESGSHVTNHSVEVEDITLRYVDVESRRDALEAEQKTLLSMMDKAETIEEMIQIENALTDVRYELQQIKSQLRVFDNQVQYSTVYINMTEVRKFTQVEPLSTGERIAKGFKDNLDSVLYDIREGFIWFVTHIPEIILTIVKLLIALVLIRIAYLVLKKIFGGKLFGRKLNGKRGFGFRKRKNVAEVSEPKTSEPTASEPAASKPAAAGSITAGRSPYRTTKTATQGKTDAAESLSGPEASENTGTEKEQNG